MKKKALKKKEDQKLAKSYLLGKNYYKNIEEETKPINKNNKKDL